MKIKILPLRRAILLYKTLKPYFPDKIEDDSFDFVHQIIRNIKDSEGYSDYANALEIMTEKSFEEIAEENDPLDVIEIFTDGLFQNKILLVKAFCEEMGL